MNDYGKPLREEDVDPDPLRQFAIWFREAGTAGIRMPEAVALATASANGVPSPGTSTYRACGMCSAT